MRETRLVAAVAVAAVLLSHCAHQAKSGAHRSTPLADHHQHLLSPASALLINTVFANQLAAAAPDVPVVIAHGWGGGAYSDEAMGVYADAVAGGRRNLYFDVSGVVNAAGSREALQRIVMRMRQIGLERFFFASDGPDYLDLHQLDEVWPQFRERVPLTEAELAQLAANVAPLLAQPVDGQRIKR